MMFQHNCGNRLLRRLNASDFAAVTSNAEVIVAEEGTLEDIGDAEGKYVFFPELGIVSQAIRQGPHQIDVALVGREGFLGLSAVLNSGREFTIARITRSGTLIRIPSATMRQALVASDELKQLLLRYSQVYSAQIGSSLLASALADVTVRVARWLLMFADRSDSVELSLTHETIARALNVRRPSVTVATHSLEGERAILAARGKIVIRDRARLQALAGHAYGFAEREYRVLLGPEPT